MTYQVFSAEHKGWISVGKISEISCLEETPREFLEAISSFILLKNQGLVPEAGVVMPALRPGIILPPITEIETIPVQGTPFDLYVLVKPAQII